MTAGLAATMAEDRRGVLLRVLHDQGDFALNDGVLQDALDRVGHRVARDVVLADLAFLAELGLLEIERLGSLALATLTRRGVDVATGRAIVPGVKRPPPRA